MRSDGVHFSPQSNGKTTNYQYDAGGNRIKKTNSDGSYIIYVIANGTVLGEKHYSQSKILQKTLRYIYDENGSVCGYTVSNEGTYHFIKNLQGDVIRVYRLGDNAIVASYSYDSWGNIISATGEKAQENPFRYRGYYYDSESGFYATGSRYYDPEIGRFINADGYVSTGQGIIGFNMYIYCGNNPINRIDQTGMFWKEIGDCIKNAWNSVKSWASNIFGGGTTVVEQHKQETEIVPPVINEFITIKTGTVEDFVISSTGDSSKPISGYAIGRSDNPLLSSAGINVNIKNFTESVSVGLDNIGISRSICYDDITYTYAIRVDLSQLKVGVETSSTIKWSDNTQVTSYTNASVSAYYILYAYCYFVYGQPVPVTQSAR